MRRRTFLFGMGSLFLTGLAVLRWRSRIPEVSGTPSVLVPASDLRFDPGDWPCWRGIAGDGRSQASPPLNWSESEGVLWKTPVPGRGHSSPIVCKGRVFLTTAREDDQTQSLVCHHADTGARLWEAPCLVGGAMRMHPKNTPASSTPACDGERVFVAGIGHDRSWLTAVDLDGGVVWKREVGPFVS